jgi:hypothetical protein
MTGISPQRRPVAQKVALTTFSALMIIGTAHSPAAADDITNIILTKRGANCAAFAQENQASVTDVQRGKAFLASVQLAAGGANCTLVSNAIPNHDFNATGRFATNVKTQTQQFTISAQPRAAARPTALSLAYDNGVFLNGVKLDQMAAGCYGVGDGRIGCNDMSAPYRYDPLGGTDMFGADEHNAHTQPSGAYHYHGNPVALFDQTGAAGPSPVIGFAADGFPIFGSYIADGGGVRKARSSYQLKAGMRAGGPGGAYDGTFVDDWEYVAGSGDLDQCNGMVQDGVYGYVVTDTYPHVMGCFTGTPDPSFRKRR